MMLLLTRLFRHATLSLMMPLLMPPAIFCRFALRHYYHATLCRHYFATRFRQRFLRLLRHLRFLDDAML